MAVEVPVRVVTDSPRALSLAAQPLEVKTTLKFGDEFVRAFLLGNHLNTPQTDLILWARSTPEVWLGEGALRKTLLNLSLFGFDDNKVAKRVSDLFGIPQEKVRPEYQKALAKLTERKRQITAQKDNSEDEEPEDFDEEIHELEHQAGRLEEETQVPGALNLYLSEIRSTPLLNAGEERARAVVYINQRSERQRLEEDPRVSGESLRLAREKERTYRNALVQPNLRLVVSVAKKFRGRGLEIEDLIQEGNLGLMRAVEKFDPQKGFRFSTYAIWWIRQAVHRALQDKVKTIRIPVHMGEILARYMRSRSELQQRFKRSVSDEEVAFEMGVTVDKVAMYREISAPPISLDKPVGDDELTIGDLVASNESSVETEAELSDRLERMTTLLEGVLDKRELATINLRFGLLDGNRRTLQEIGDELQISRERVRQIEVAAIRKLRRSSRTVILRSWLD